MWTLARLVENHVYSDDNEEMPETLLSTPTLWLDDTAGTLMVELFDVRLAGGAG